LPLLARLRAAQHRRTEQREHRAHERRTAPASSRMPEHALR
jgi:hypothetical protein